jgi:hypothetical protein
METPAIFSSPTTQPPLRTSPTSASTATQATDLSSKTREGLCQRKTRKWKKDMAIVESGRVVKEVVPLLSDRFVVRGYVFRSSWRSED